MACSNCQSTNNITYTIGVIPACPCTCSTPVTSSCDPCGTDTLDASKVTWSGAALTCTGSVAGDTVELIIQRLDEQVCQATGADFSSYDTSCIVNEDDSPITTQQQFVERISDYVCNLEVVHNTFVTEVYNTFVTEITDSISSNNLVGITSCAAVGIVPTDTNAQAFVKVADQICAIYDEINMDDIVWTDYGFDPGVDPTTVREAIGKLLQYIGETKNLIPTAVSIPTFNNIGSCLGGTLTATDSLFATVDKIKTKLCSLDYDLGGLTFGCVSSSGTLWGILQNILTRVNLYKRYTFEPTQFTVTAGATACDPVGISLNLTGMDSKVASNSADASPGYLIDKLSAGAGITLDDTSTPGEVIITSTASGDHKVLVNGLDGSADYLDAKIDGAPDTTGTITLSATSNGGNSQVIVTPVVDFDVLQSQTLNFIQGDVTALAAWSAFICSVACGPAGPNVRVVVTAGTTDKLVRVQADQNTPTLPWYDSGAVVISSGASINGGPYGITSVALNPQATLTIDNNGTGTYNYTVYVTDVFGTPVSGSTIIPSTPIVAGGSVGWPSFQLGTGTTDYVIHVDFA